MTKGIGSSIGGYTIESLLGRGGMSTVYIAEDAKLGRKVALKIMSEELSENEAFRSRFIREAKMAANLEHPNIVPVYDAGEADDVLYLAMRVIRGTDLRRVITEEGPMDAERTMGIMRQIASALDAAHRAGLVHRDVKPANILLSHDGEEEHAYLSDFGLTKHVSSRSGLTKTGTFMGTIDYVAPEQIRGDEVDGRTDLYSLACVLYECLTGEVPFTKDQDVAILFAHLEDERPHVSAKRADLSGAIDDVLARAMAKRKEERFDTCLAFVDAARRALDLAPAVRSTSPPTILAPPPAAPSPGSEAGREPHPSFPPVGQPSTPPAVSGTAPPAGAPGAGSSSSVQVPAPPEASRPVAAPVTAPPVAAAPRGRSNKRLALFIGAPLLAIVAVAVIVFAMGGSDQPEPPPPPPAPTGPSPPTTVSNAQAIVIPKSGSATPYPSTIEVSDLRGVVTDLNVELDGFEHAFPADVDVALVGPGGQNVDLMNGVGGFGSVSGLTFTFDDEGTPLKEGRKATSGTFSPSSSSKREGFGFRGPPPAPSAPHGTSLAVFNGTDPNGTWELYVFDDSDRDAGRITGGWALNLELGTAAASPGPTGASGSSGASGATGSAGAVIFQDDFSNPASGWDVFDEPRTHGLYRDGAYVLGVDGGFLVTGDFNTSTQELSTLGDVRVETTAHLTSGDSGLYGVVCRAATPTSYYYFLVQTDGSFYIGEAQGKQAHNFDTGRSPAIARGAEPNTIAAECVDGPEGVTLRMFVNGIAVNTVIDTEAPIRIGATGFRAESQDTDMEVAFDDFVVSAPS